MLLRIYDLKAVLTESMAKEVEKEEFQVQD